MTRMLAGLFVSSTVPAVLGCSTQCEQKVTVYLRDSSVVPNPVWGQARYLAAKMFSAANVRIDWRIGAQLPSKQGIVVSMVADAPTDSFRGALAYTQLYAGAHITVFWDRIEHPARPASMGAILAHVLVHEITHILQRIDRHSETGIMKAAWSNQDFRDMAWKGLSFTPHDIVLICLGRED